MRGEQTLGAKPTLDYVFHPRSIAIAGVADESAGFNAGRNFLTVLRDAGYKGAIYPLNPKGGQVYGMPIYPSLKDVPQDVDYVISAVPARHAPRLMEECVAKGVKLVHFFSAGFSESGDDEGKRLEASVAAIARQGNVRVTGPNGMGLYCPSTGLSFTARLPLQSGPFGFLSQSGSNSTYVIREGSTRGLFFSKAVSYGNGADLNESDFLEYFGEDPETEIIGAYIEGVKDGRRFANVLRKAAASKPVIVLKGGVTEAGGRAAASHTGAISGAEGTWNSLLKQAGAIQVQSLDELIDVALLFRFMSPPAGKDVAIVGFGGGIGVQAADFCTHSGLRVPPVSPEIRSRLTAIWPTEAGSSFRNPIDLFGASGQKGIELTLRVVAGWQQAQLVLVYIPVFINPQAGAQLLRSYSASLANLAPELARRTVVVLSFTLEEETARSTVEARTTLWQAGFPVFYSVERAVAAMGRFSRYYEARRAGGR